MSPITRLLASFVFSVLAVCLLLIIPAAAEAGLPPTLSKAHFDWVCVTDAGLVEAYAPLADHRRDQGLDCLVVPLDEAILWSPAADDTIATLRWLAGVAHRQWGARYLLLGGSHALLPAPLHRFDHPAIVSDCPTDAYYACLDGDWDVNGNGFVAEWEVDAADPTVHLAVGRVPADDEEAVRNFVIKTIAFERRQPAAADGALFVSSLMLHPPYEAPNVYPNQALLAAAGWRDTVMALRPDLRVGTLFQGPDPTQGVQDPLNPYALVDSLGARSHDFVHCQVRGIDTGWELVYAVLQSYHVESLADCGHMFVMAMVSGPVADTRDPGILQRLLTLRGGGAVAAIAPTGYGIIMYLYDLQEALWPRLVDTEAPRLGDVFAAALADVIGPDGWVDSARAATYLYQALLGDPALVVTPPSGTTSGAPDAYPMRVKAVPNPFNPATTISFEVAGGNGGLQPVQVEVFDVRGQRITTLLDAHLLPGAHEISWQAQVASGVYFARVTVAGRHVATKLTLVE